MAIPDSLVPILLLLAPAAVVAALAIELLRRRGEARLTRELEALREAARQDRAALASLEAEIAELRGDKPAPKPSADDARLMKGLVAKLRARRDRRKPAGAEAEAAAEVTAETTPTAPIPLRAGPAKPDQTALRDEAAASAPPPPDEATLLRAVRDALTHDFVELVLQPVVSLPQRRRRFYECTTRIRDGENRVIAAADYIPVAERAGLVAAIDNILLFRCIQLVRSLRRRDETVDFFCNVSAATLRDESFFADFVDYLAQHPEPAAHLIFEFSHLEFDGQGPRARALLERLRALGCRLSIDGAEPERLDPEALAARGVGFVKLAAPAVLDYAQHYGAAAAAALMQDIAAAGLVAIVERVEDEDSLRELLDFGPDFGQGYLFGEPRPARNAA